MTRHGAQSIKDGHAWWAALGHGGLLLSPVVLNEWLPGGLPAPDDRRYRRLRDRFTAFQAKTAGDGDRAAVHEWLDALLEEFLGHPKERWRKGADIPEQAAATSVTGQRLRPHRVLLGESGAPSVLVAVDDSPRVGLHRGRRAHARFVELLRLTGHRLGLLTNGRQFRLCYAGLDHDAWCEWEAEVWFAEGETRGQLQGLIAQDGPLCAVSPPAPRQSLPPVRAAKAAPPSAGCEPAWRPSCPPGRVGAMPRGWRRHLRPRAHRSALRTPSARCREGWTAAWPRKG